LSDRKSWRIHSQIGFGYFLALGVGVVGALTGMLVADYYQGKGVEQLLDAQVQSQLLYDFGMVADQTQLHALRVEVVLEDADQLQAERDRLQKYLAKLETLTIQVDEFLDDNPAWLAAAPTEIQTLLQTYGDRLTVYVNQVDAIAVELSADAISEPALAAARQALRTAAIQPDTLSLDDLQQDLAELQQIARQQELQGSVVMENVQGFEKLIIALSMLASAAVAGVIAWRTTRAIARPVEHISQMAREAAVESNFDLRVPVDSNNEIGTLATSLNLLLQRMTDYTRELQQSARLAEDQAAQLQATLQELQQTQAQLLHAEKMSSLGQLVAGIAHEINNPVSFIHGNLTHANQYTQDLLRLVELYQAHIPQVPQPVQQYQDQIDLEFLQSDLPKLLLSMKVGTERICSIVLSLRIFSRLNESEVKAVDLHEGIDSTLLILGSRLKPQPDRPAIEVVKRYSDLPLVDCYAGQLNQVFMNLLSNAIDALEEAWFAGQVTEPQIQIQTTIAPQDQVEIRIIDNGPGIPAEVKAKLFDPFFTTKPVGKGTGMGLSISYQLVADKHHGSLECYSQPGQGTAFIVRVPIHQF
jgi:signal transduction histidine kinase